MRNFFRSFRRSQPVEESDHTGPNQSATSDIESGDGLKDSSETVEVHLSGVKRDGEKLPDNPCPSKIMRLELDEGSSNEDWELPQEMLEYLNKYLSIKDPEKKLKQKILNANPIPRNVNKVKDVDSYIKDLLVENNKNTCLQIEKILKPIQDKVNNILGPV